MSTVVLLGTLDTKWAEIEYVRSLLLAANVKVTLIDCGIFPSASSAADIGPETVARAGGSDLRTLASGNNRGAAVIVMATGAERIVAELWEKGQLDGALALGGTGGTSIAATAFRSLPLGVPKLIVSTAASGDTSGYVAESDLMLAPSVVDIAGLNRISKRILANAAGAMAGMVTMPKPDILGDVKLVAASMFGVTTSCVTEGRRLLESDGYEVLTFHMTGSGGRTLEALVRDSMLAGVLDITTTELADELVGGVFSAGPCRLTCDGAPRVVSVGALDMVNFGPADTVPTRFRDRNLFVHNSSVTLMRTTPDECAELGRRLASRVVGLSAPVTVMLPLAGISAISQLGGAFHDPVADDALFTSIREVLSGSHVQVVEMATDINDPSFADRAVSELHALMRGGEAG